MNRPSPVVERLLIGTALAATFLLMASVFVPDLGHAQPSPEPPPTDPHAAYASLGSIEDDEYIIRAFGGGPEPLYSVYRRSTNEELAVLLPAYAVHAQFPDVPLLEMDFGAESPVMLAEPEVLHFQ